MSIAGFDDLRLKAVLADNLTPSDFITTPERLFGRDKPLTSIDRALSSPGRQIFIYGDRGVGKTSLALTAAYLNTHASLAPIHVNCGTTAGFLSVIQAIGNAALPIKSKMEKPGTKPSFGLSVLGTGVSLTMPSAGSPSIPAPLGLTDALEIIRYIDGLASGGQVVVVDEMERISSPADKDQFAEFIKNVSTASRRLKFVFCGIATDVTDILGSHPSAGRILETIPLDRIPHDSLWRIIQTPSRNIGVHIDQDKLIRISQISDGFPHYVHLIGESLFWGMYDDPEPVARVEHRHYKSAIKKALTRTEAVWRNQFDQATKKTKNTDDYEEVLWSLADKTSDRRQLTDIYEQSYMKIMGRRSGRDRLPKEKFNQRLLSLRKESHSRIVKGYGAGWFAFRENIMRGYVRLDAENKDIEIGRDW